MSDNLNPNRRKFAFTAALGVAAPMLFRVGAAAAAEPVMVEIENGKLRGVRNNGAVSFKGVPYAADTGGSNRFMAPRPVANWTGVRDAFQLGDRCPQVTETMSQVPVFAWYGQGQTSGFSENCCVLNVYTPDLDPKARRPVMFYIHGGAYTGGGGGGPALEGSNLAKFGDAVVVTINHRLNVFGYTTLGHVDADFADAANAGQLDLIAALGWVKRNISAFGGDPDNVTVFGQSGGGSKIMVLMAMPEAKGLFHRAISMSGAAGLRVGPAASLEPHSNAILKTLGIDKGNLRKLQEVSADMLLKARAAALVATKLEGARTVIDGRHVLTNAMTPQGLAVHASVPLMLGTADTESTLALRSDMRNFQVSANQLKARIKAQFGVDDAKADAIMAGYREDDPGRTPADILIALATDTQFRIPMIRGAEAKSNAGQAPVYMYNFIWKVPVDGGIWRTPHAVDIPFAFGNVDKATMMTGGGAGPVEVSRNVMSAFVAFARSGNPNNPRLPEWKQYDSTTRATMTFDVKSQTVNDFRRADRLTSMDLRIDPFNPGALFRYGE